jgi:hypothetical protein
MILKTPGSKILKIDMLVEIYRTFGISMLSIEALTRLSFQPIEVS